MKAHKMKALRKMFSGSLDSEISNNPELEVLLRKREKVAKNLFQDIDLQRAIDVTAKPDKIIKITPWMIDFRSPHDLFRTVCLNSGRKVDITMMFSAGNDELIASYIDNIRVTGLHLKSTIEQPTPAEINFKQIQQIDDTPEIN